MQGCGQAPKSGRPSSSGGVHGSIGIGHVRWATHGRPSEENAHPHRAGSIVVVHNGVIENYMSLKKSLISEGRVFTSETDTEAIAHLIDSISQTGMPLDHAVRETAQRLEGAYAIAVIDERNSGIVVRKGSPLIVGVGQGDFFLASDNRAILHRARDVLFLNYDEIVILSDTRRTENIHSRADALDGIC